MQAVGLCACSNYESRDQEDQKVGMWLPGKIPRGYPKLVQPMGHLFKLLF